LLSGQNEFSQTTEALTWKQKTNGNKNYNNIFDFNTFNMFKNISCHKLILLIFNNEIASMV